MHRGESEHSEGVDIGAASELTPYSIDTPAPYSVDTKGPEVTAEIQVIAEAENSVRRAVETLMETRGMTKLQARWEVMHHLDPERFEDQRKAQRALDIDDKTQVWSDRALQRALGTAESESGTSVIIFDINNFREVNKIAGHVRGDDILRRAATCIRRASRQYGYDRVFRRGGDADEFVALAPNDVAEKIRDDAERLFGKEVIESKGEQTVVSLSGMFGGTEEEAGDNLNERKLEHKSGQRGLLDSESSGDV
jgi:diguanylate cyclase (GGDEF)-like protein